MCAQKWQGYLATVEIVALDCAKDPKALEASLDKLRKKFE
jgi:hypothetical protein